MKKIIYIVILCVCFGSCTVSQPAEQPKEENTLSSVKMNLESTAQPREESPISGGGSGDVAFLTLYSYDEYLDFISKNEIPDSFLTYESLRFIGEFKGLTVRSFYAFGNFDAYHYDFVDDLGYSITVSVRMDHDPEKDMITKDYLLQPPQDLRVLESKSKKWLMLGDFEYLYLQGKLCYVYLYSGNMRITISGNPHLYEYPTTKSTTFLSQLLNIETVEAASNRFVAAVAPALQAR